jgi:hypothetical protein
MTGKCIDLQMRAFRDACPKPLTAKENHLFRQSFLANRLFGGLPLLLVYDRFDFLKEAILDVWNDPSDRDSIAVVHQMMNYYSILTGNRREADQKYKCRAKSKTPIGNVPRDISLPDNYISPSKTSDHLMLEEIARRLAIAHGYDSGLLKDELRAILDVMDDKIIVMVNGGAPDNDGRFEISREEFERVAREVADDWR